MSKLIEQGGPAFPMHDARDVPVGSVSEYNQLMTGMTLRDYFAAKALPVLLNDPQGLSVDNIARAAYGLADAMLKVRGEQ